MTTRTCTPDACLDDETLAAYVDGGLTAVERARVERHLAACQRCFAVFAETVRTVQGLRDADGEVPSDTPGTPVMAPARGNAQGWLTRRLLAGGALAAAAVLAAAVWWPRPASRPELVDLVAAVGNRRPVEGRLTGGFGFGPIESPTRGGEPGTDWRVLAAAGKLEEQARGTESPRLLGALGTAHLVTRDLDGAVKYFDQAVDLGPDDPVLRTDRSAALLARGEVAGGGGTEDFVRALDDASRAVSMAPTLAEARFNKALALQRMHLPDEELAAWREYLEVDGASPWAESARARIAALQNAPRSQSRRDADAFARWLPPVPAMGSRASYALAPLIADHRQRAREWLEGEALPQWGRATIRDDGVAAEHWLAAGRLVAVALVAAGGDAMPLAAIEGITQTDGRDRRRLHELATAHLAYAEAARLLDGVELKAAATKMREAAPAFQQAGSPYALWRPVLDAIADRMAGRTQAAMAALAAVAWSDVPARYAYLVGRAEWTRAVCLASLGRLDQASDAYLDALQRLDGSGETTYVAQLHAMLADTLSQMGDYASAWSHQADALAELSLLRGTPRSDVILLNAAMLALDLGLNEAALPFQNSLLAARAASLDQRLPEAYLQRANTLALNDRHADAERDLASADPLVRALRDDAVRERLAAEWHGVRARLPTAAPLAVVESSDRALAYFRPAGHRLRAVSLLVWKARALERLSRWNEAEAALADATLELEAHRAALLTPEARATSFEEGRAAVSETVRLLAVVRGQPDRGLAAAERGRARALTEPTRDAMRTPSEVASSLPDGAAVLFYAVLDDRVLVWTLTRGHMQYRDVALALPELQRAVNAFNGAILRGADRPELARLSRPLLRLLSDDGAVPQGVSTLVLVADGPLYGLAFSALVQGSGRYLVEDAAVLLSPSLSAVAFGEGVAVRSVVTVGDGSGDERLPKLPHADAEAAAIGALYPAHTVLTAASAIKPSVLALAATHDVLHFAGHTVVNASRPERSGLVLASDGAGTSALLSAGELYRRSPGTLRVVVLSSCEGAAGRYVAGEGTLSVARAFLASGAEFVIASVWPVRDRDAGDLVGEVHRQLRQGHSPAQALRAAQVAALRSGTRTAALPVAWAGFITLGKRKT